MGIHLIFIAFSLLCIVPIILVVSISISNDQEMMRHGYSIIPREISFKGYEFIFTDPMLLLRSFGVSLFNVVAGTALSMWFTATLGYVVSRRDFRLANKISLFIFVTLLFNGGLIPSYLLISKYLHLKDNIFVMIVPLLVNAWNVLLMKGFMQSIPVAVIESAKIDGASEFGTFIRIVIPMAKSGIATLALFSVLAFWNDWFTPLLYIASQNLVPLQLLLYRMMSNADYLSQNIGPLVQGVKLADLPTISARMAMVVVAIGPMLPVFLFFQKYFVKGLTVGAVKG